MTPPERSGALIVEDDDRDYAFLAACLEEGQAGHWRVARARNLAGALAQAKAQPPDVVLLDIFLPDGDGLKVLDALSEAGYHPAVIVVSSAEDDKLEPALAAGAQDFIFKGKLTSDLLRERIRAARMRQRYWRDRLRSDDEARENLDWLANVAATRRSPVTARMVGEHSLQEADPDGFATAAQRFLDILTLSLEERRLQVRHGVRTRVASLSVFLGHVSATHADVVAIMQAAVDRLVKEGPPEREWFVLREARHRGFQLLGYMAMYYRDQALGRSMGREEKEES